MKISARVTVVARAKHTLNGVLAWAETQPHVVRVPAHEPNRAAFALDTERAEAFCADIKRRFDADIQFIVLSD